MGSIRKRQISRQEKLYCRKKIDYGNKSFEIGDIFPWKKIDANWRRVIDMFGAFDLINKNDACFDDVMGIKNARLSQNKPTESIEESTDIVEEPTKKNIEIRNHGRGMYSVTVDGVIVNDTQLNKSDAVKLMRRLENE